MDRRAVAYKYLCEGDVSAGGGLDLGAAVYGDRYVAELGGDGDAAGADGYDITEDAFAGQLARVHGLECSRGSGGVIIVG